MTDTEREALCARIDELCAEVEQLHGEMRLNGFKWHLIDEKAPRRGDGDYLVMTTRKRLYGAVSFKRFEGQDFFYLPFRDIHLMPTSQVLAWAEIPPLEVSA